MQMLLNIKHILCANYFSISVHCVYSVQSETWLILIWCSISETWLLLISFDSTQQVMSFHLWVYVIMLFHFSESQDAIRGRLTRTDRYSCGTGCVVTIPDHRGPLCMFVEALCMFVCHPKNLFSLSE